MKKIKKYTRNQNFLTSFLRSLISSIGTLLDNRYREITLEMAKIKTFIHEFIFVALEGEFQIEQYVPAWPCVTGQPVGVI